MITTSRLLPSGFGTSGWHPPPAFENQKIIIKEFKTGDAGFGLAQQNHFQMRVLQRKSRIPTRGLSSEKKQVGHFRAVRGWFEVSQACCLLWSTVYTK